MHSRCYWPLLIVLIAFTASYGLLIALKRDATPRTKPIMESWSYQVNAPLNRHKAPSKFCQTAWNAMLPVGALERGMIYKGNGCRMHKFIEKLNDRQAVVAAALGGSITAGHQLHNPSRDAFPHLFFTWINTCFPSLIGNHTFLNSGRGGMTSSVFALCTESFVPHGNIDLILVEFTINDGPVQSEGMEARNRKHFESLLRGLLQLPGNPAIVMLHSYSWWNGYKGATPYVGSYYGDRGGESSEESLSLLAKYYDIPVLSLKTAVYPLMAAGMEGFRADRLGDMISPVEGEDKRGSEAYGDQWKPYFYADKIHLNENGHRAMADLLIHTVEEHRRASPKVCTVGLRGLPPVMIDAQSDYNSCPCLLNPYLFDVDKPSEHLSDLNIKQEGFEYAPLMPQELNESDQKWTWTAAAPGAWMEIDVPFCDAHLLERNSNKAVINIGYLRGTHNFGKARVICTSGCHCNETVLDGVWTDQSTQTDVSALEVLYEKEWSTCTLYIRVFHMKQLHRFVLTFLQLELNLRKGEETEPVQAWREWLGLP